MWLEMYAAPVSKAKQQTREKEVHDTKTIENINHSTSTRQIPNNTKCKILIFD